ncbi:hypothetical protein RI367_005526 [Sorochytrium milnesiophthora]
MTAVDNAPSAPAPAATRAHHVDEIAVYANDDASLTHLDDRADLLDASDKHYLRQRRRKRAMIGCGVFTVFLVAMILIAYLVIIPKMIRNIFHSGHVFLYPQDGKLSVNADKSQAVNVDVRAQIFAGCPMNTIFAPQQWEVKFDNTHVITIPLGEILCYSDKRSEFHIVGDIVVVNEDKLNQVVGMLSSPQGLDDANKIVNIDTKLGVTVMGVKLYKGLAATKIMDLTNVTIPALIDAMVNKQRMPGVFGEVAVDPTLEKYPLPAKAPVAPLTIRGLKMNAYDKGFTLDTTVNTGNPLPVAFSLPSASVIIGLYNTNVLKIRARNIVLASGPDAHDMTPSVDFELLDDYANIGQLLQRTVMDLVGTGSAQVTIAGPAELYADPATKFEPTPEPGSDISQSAPQKRSVTDPKALISGSSLIDPSWQLLQYLIDATKALGVNLPPSIFSKLIPHHDGLGGFKASSLFEGIGLQANISASTNNITVPIKITLPETLQLPQLDLQWALGLSLYANDAEIVQLSVQGVSIDHVDNTNHVRLTAVITPSQNATSADAIAAVVDAILNQNKIGTLVVKNVNINPMSGKDDDKCVWCQQLFSGLELPLPIPPVHLKDKLIAMLSQPAAAPAPEDANKPKFAVKGLDVKQSGSEPAVDVTLTADLPELGFIGHVDVPFFKVDLQVDDSTAVSLSLPNGIRMSSGDQNSKLQLHALFSNDNNVPQKVAGLVSRFINKDDTGLSTVAISGLGIGNSPQDYFHTLEKIKIGMNTNDIKEVMTHLPSGSSPLSGFNMNGLIKPTFLDVNMIARNQVTLSTHTALNLPFSFPVTIDIGSLSLSALLNDQSLIDVSLPPIKLASGNNEIDLPNILITLSDAEGVRPVLGQLINQVVQKQPLSEVLGLTGITLSPTAAGNSTGSSPAAIRTLSQVKVAVPLGSMSGAGSVLDTSLLLPAGLAMPAIKLNKASVATQANAVLDLGASLTLVNPVPVSINLPFAALTVRLDNADLVTISIGGLNLGRGSDAKTLNLDVKLAFSNSDDIQNKVAALASALFSGGDSSLSVGFGGILLGTSPTQTTQLLSQVWIAMPVSNLLGAVKSLGSSGSGSGLLPKIDMSAVAFKPQSLSIAAAAHKRVNVGLQATFNNPLPIDIDIGFFSLTASANGQPVVTISLSGLKVAAATGNTLNLQIALDFVDTPDTQAAVAQIVKEVFTFQQFKSSVGVASLLVGVNAQDTIRTFSHVNLNLPLSSLTTPDALRGMLGGAGAGGLPVGFAGGSLAVLPGKKIHADLSLSLNLPMALSVDVGFAAVQVFVDDVLGVDLALSGIKTSQDSKTLALSIDINVHDSPELTAKVTSLVNALLSHQELKNMLIISGARFGLTGNDADVINTLAQAKLVVPLASLNTGGIALPSLGGGAFTPSNISVALKPGDVIEVDLAAHLGISLPVSLDLPYAEIKIRIDDMVIAVVSVSNIKLTPTTQDLALSVSIHLIDAGKPETQAKIADLVKQALVDHHVTSVLALTGIHLGASPADYIAALEGVVIPVPLDSLLSNLPSLGGGAGGLPFAAKDINVAFKAGQQIAVTLSAHLNINIPVSIDLPYVALRLRIDDAEFADVSLSGLKLTPGVPDLQLAIAIQILHDGDVNVQNKVADLVQQVFTHQVHSSLFITGFRFGASPQDNIAMFQLVAFPIPLAPLVGNLPSLGGGAGGLPFAAKNVSVAFQPADLITIDLVATLGISLPISLDLPYAEIKVRIDDAAIALISITGVKIAPGTKDLALSIGVHILGDDDANNQAKVAGLVKQALVDHHITSVVAIAGIHLGISAQDNIALLQAVVVPLPLDSMLGSLPSIGGGAGGLPLSAKDIKIATKPGDLIAVDLVATLGFDMPLSIDLPYAQINIRIDNTVVAAISISGVKVAPGTKDLALSVGVQIINGNTDDVQNAIAAMIMQLVAGNPDAPVKHTLFIAGVHLGVSAQDNISLLQLVAFPLPLDQILHGFAQQGMSTLGAGNSTAPALSMRNVTVNFLPQRVVEISLTAGLPITIPVSVQVGYASVSIGLGPLDVASIALTQPITVTPETKELSLALRIQVAQEPQLPLVIAQLVDAITNGKEVTGVLTLSKIALGFSEKDHINAFQRVVVPVPLSQFTQILHTLPAVASSEVSGSSAASAFGLRKLHAATPGGGRIELAIGASIGINIPIDITVGYAALDIVLAGTPAFTIQLSNLRLTPGMKDLDISLAIIVHDSDDLANKLAVVVPALMAGDLKHDITITGVYVGFSATDNIDALSKAQLTVSLQTLAGLMSSGSSAMALPDLSGALGSLKPSLSNIAIATPADRPHTVTVGVQVAFNVQSQLDLNIDIGHLALAVGLNDINLLTVMVDNIKAQNGQNTLALNVAVVFESLSDAQATALSVAVRNVFVRGDLRIFGFALGHSATDSITSFGKIVIHLDTPKLLAPLINAVSPKALSVDDAQGLQDAFQAHAEALVSAAADSSATMMGGMQFSNIVVDASTPYEINVVLAGSLGANFPISVDVGHLGLSFGYQAMNIVRIEMDDIKLSSQSSAFSLAIKLTPYLAKEDRQAATGLKTLVNDILANKTAPLKMFVVSYPTIGVKAPVENRVDTFRKVTWSLIPVNLIFKNGYPAFALPSAGGMKIGFNGVKFNDGGIEVDLDLGFNLGMPLHVNIPYLATDISADGFVVGTLSMTGVVLQPGDNHINLPLHFKFSLNPLDPNTPAPWKKLLGDLWHAIMNKDFSQFNIMLGQILIGASPDQIIDTASKVMIPLTHWGTPGAPPASNPISFLFSLDNINGFLSQKGVELDADVSLGTALTIQNVDSINLNVLAQGNPIFNVVASGISQDASNKLKPHVLVAPVLPAAAAAVSGIYEAMKAGQQLTGVSVGGITIKLQDGSVYQFLSSLNVDLPPTQLSEPQFLGKLGNIFTEGIGIDVKTVINVPVKTFITIGHLYFEAYQGDNMIGTVNHDKAFNSDDGGLITFVKSSTLNPIKLIELLINLEKNENQLKNFDITTSEGSLVWAKTILNSINLRLHIKRQSF